MKHLYLIFTLAILAVSCNTSNQAEKEYIKNLEEKNKILEQELSDMENDLEENLENVQPVKSKKYKNNDYFTIGASEKEVLEVMGNPSSYQDILGTKIMRFGSSSVKFNNGKVTGYDNYSKNLKVKLIE